MNIEVLQEAVRVLNEALRLDPTAINALFLHRVAVNVPLAEHSTIQVRRSSPPPADTLGVLGLLNGIFGADVDGIGYLCSLVEDERIIRFELRGGAKLESTQRIERGCLGAADRTLLEVLRKHAGAHCAIHPAVAEALRKFLRA